MWPIFLPEYNDDFNGINLYKFIDALNNVMDKVDVVVSMLVPLFMLHHKLLE